MILLDNQEGSYELAFHEPLRSLLDPCSNPLCSSSCTWCRGSNRDMTRLPSGDIMIIGKGPNNSPLSIGIEYKKVGELLDSLHSKRFQGFQHPNMCQDYQICFLLVAGRVREHLGMLQYTNGSTSKWHDADFGGNFSYTYSAYQKFISGPGYIQHFNLLPVETIEDAARQVCAVYEVYSKPWTAHKSFRCTQDVAIRESRFNDNQLTPLVNITRNHRNWIRFISSIPGVDFEIASALCDVFSNVDQICNSSVEFISSILISKKNGRGLTIGPNRASNILEFLTGKKEVIKSKNKERKGIVHL
jgi:ERCC4-type nuclease